MSQLLHLQEKLQTVGATMGQLEMEVARHPESSGLAANMRSLRKLHDTLRDDFAYAANRLGLDVLHYRLLDDIPTAKALSGSMGTFQDAITVAYDAIKHGPKSRRQVATVIAAETALQVAYSYPGSFGVVFTVPTQRMLIPDMPSDLDRAVKTVLDLGKAYSNRQMISEVEHRLGKATVTAVYTWAKTNAQTRTGTAIEWRRSDAVRADVLIQEPEFKALSETLEKMAGTETKRIFRSGILVGADTKSHTFHFVTSSDDDIRGKFSDAISELKVAELPRRYKATIQATTEKTYATEEEVVTYFLDKLEPI